MRNITAEAAVATHCPQENVSLLKEINDLRQELKKTRTHAHDLGAIVTVARKQGFDEQAARTATKPLTPLTGLAKVSKLYSAYQCDYSMNSVSYPWTTVYVLCTSTS